MASAALIARPANAMRRETAAMCGRDLSRAAARDARPRRRSRDRRRAGREREQPRSTGTTGIAASTELPVYSPSTAPLVDTSHVMVRWSGSPSRRCCPATEQRFESSPLHLMRENGLGKPNPRRRATEGFGAIIVYSYCSLTARWRARNRSAISLTRVWTYSSDVVAIDAWPSRIEMSSIATPSRRSRVAYVWRAV